MKQKGLWVVLLATLALSLNAAPCSESGQCEDADSADTSTLLQSRVNVHEAAEKKAAAAAAVDSDPTYIIHHHEHIGTPQETGNCPGGWTTGKPTGATKTVSMGKADSEDHCVQKVNDNHPHASGANACMHNNCGGERECFAFWGATGTEIAKAGSKEVIHQESCFFEPKAMLEEIASGQMGTLSAFADESEIDEIADEVEKGHDATEHSQTVEVKDACDPCDTACVEKTSQESFGKCDADKNNKLSVKEIQDCTLDETGKGSPMGVSLGEVVSDAKAREILAYYDEDKDDGLSPEEWLKAEVPCEASLRQEGEVVSEETVVAKCVSKIVSKVFKRENFKCKKTTKSKHCSLVQTEQQEQGKEQQEQGKEQGKATEDSQEVQGDAAATTKDAMESRWGGRRRRRWGGGRRRWWRRVVRAITCVWKTIVSWVDCVRQVIVNVVRSAVAGFRDCWNEVRKAVGGAYMDLIKNCHSVDSCLKHLLKGPKALWDKIVALAKAGVDKLLYKGPIGKGVKWIANVIKKLPPTVKQVGSIAADIGVAITKFVAGAIKSIKELGNINMCTTKGYGFWYFWPTDCGAFGQMKKIFTWAIHKVPSIFADVVKRFGRCVIKLGMLSLPSPFLDVKVKSWCVPKLLQPVVKGIVGMFRFLIRQIIAGVSGCSGSYAKEPVCIMVDDMRKIGDKLKALFSSQFLQKSTEVIGETMTGNKDEFAIASGSGLEAKCNSATDFSFTIGLSGKVSWPPWGDSLGIGLTGAIGCRRKTLFGDFIIGLKGSLFIAGYKIKFPIARKASFCPPGVTLAFSIGTPSTDIVQWAGGFDLSATVIVFGIEAGIGLGFKVLPIPTYPTGFSVSPEIDLKCTKAALLQTEEQRAACEAQKAMLLENEARERELDDEVAKHDNHEDKMYTAVGVLIKQYSELPHEKYLNAGSYMSALQAASSHLMADEESKFPLPKKACLNAGLGVNFCCTCGISGGQAHGVPAKIASDPWPRRRRDRRRRDRRRRDRRRRDRRRRGLHNGHTVGLLGGRHRRWCADEYNRIRCNRGWIHGWERFYVWAHHGRIALRGGHRHRWCADDHHGVRCNRGWIHGWEKFWMWSGGGRVAFKGGRGHRWCADEGHRWICNRGWIHGWEKFQVQYVRRRRR